MKFELEERVWLAESEERGIVVGRAEFNFSESTYQIRYCDGQGCQREQWINESGLRKIEVVSENSLDIL